MLIGKFEEQVNKTPDKIAVKTEKHHITYRALDEYAGRIAAFILKEWRQPEQHNVYPGNIGLIIEHGADMITAILGVLRAGKAYVPISIEYPGKRVQYLLDHSQAALVLTNTGCEKKVRAVTAGAGLPVLNIDMVREPGSIPPVAPGGIIPGEQPAYLLYTSGSTGNPKGVMQNHANVLYYIDNWTQRFSITENDRLTLFSSFCHDGSVQDMFGALLNGATLYPYDVRNRDSEVNLSRFLIEEKITIYHSVPSLYNLFVNTFSGEERIPKLKYILLGGEPFRGYEIEMFKKHFPHCILANVYGQTESSVNSIWCIRAEDTIKRFIIGHSLDNTQIFVVDEEGSEVEPYETGEILVACAHISPGYWRDAETSGKVFKEDAGIGRYYCTGDLGRRLPDGNVEFMGRRDFQVKIHGYRVEIGEIETALLRLDNIREAVVVPKQISSGDTYLCAFMVMGKQLDITMLRQTLSLELPDYMIPTTFIRLEKMPLTQSNKTDRRALAMMDKETLKQHADHVPPKSEMEKIIADTWKGVLGVQEVGIHDNIFDIGGNSFDIIKINNQLGKLLNRNIPIVKLFEHPTIGALADFLVPRPEKVGIADYIVTKNEVQTRQGAAPGKSGLDIAIIGMSGRFPGAHNVAEYWDNIIKGRETITFFSDEELALAGVTPDILRAPNYVKAGGILDNIEYFDASFFGYTPGEAEILNPQTRIFYECVYEALEDAGYPPDSHDGLIGLFAGAGISYAWEALSFFSGKISKMGQFIAITLANKDNISTRVAYKLNLKGPAISIRTACSTSLVAVHLACRGLSSGDCDIALAGGITVQNIQKAGYFYQKGLVVSPDGHCRAFDADAAGTVFGDGGGVVVLKPLKNALRDRDNIYALIKGTAVNNDGCRKVGYTAPSIGGQADVVKAALKMAGVAPESIGYIETHGTGTALGDPIEVEALRLAFNTDQRHTCALGSVKANIGHLDAAAGVAGLIKTVLSLKYRLLPPSLHFKSPNPQIDFSATPFYVNTQLTVWQRSKEPLRAGVSSFGFGGTNAHVILEEAPDVDPVPGEEATCREYKLLTLSAKSPAALEKTTRNLGEYFVQNPDVNLADAVYTLQTGRKNFPYRRLLVCKELNEASRELSLPASQEVRTFTLPAKSTNPPVVFMFPGQGAQYPDMGRDLYRTEAVFREEVNRCSEILASLTGGDIKKILYPGGGVGKAADQENSPIHRTEITQPVIFTIEYALAKLLMSWGVKPAALIGHSIGEYTAACLAGVFSPEDALGLVAFRGKLMQQLPGGAMLSVPLPEDKLVPLLDEKLSLAAVNSSSHCVVSGSHEAVEAFAGQLKAQGHQVRFLHTSHAFHSSMMDSILDRFEETVRQTERNDPQIPYISNLTGQWITGGEAVDPRYWARHLRCTVRFADGLAHLLKDYGSLFLEVGPGHALSTFVRQHRENKTAQPGINLIRHPEDQENDNVFLLKSLGQLWFHGVSIDWQGFYRDEKRRRISLPTYPFERRRYWIEGNLSEILGSGSHAALPNFFGAGDQQDEELPEPPDSVDNDITLERPLLSTSFRTPVTGLEQKITEIWQELLGIKQLGIQDDFFELGGDSLKAMYIVSRIHQQTQIEIPLGQFFSRPTIEGLAVYVEKNIGKNSWTAIEPVEEMEYYPLSSAQKRLYILQQIDPGNTSYNMPVLLTLEGDFDVRKGEEILTSLIRRHESFRTSFPVVRDEPVQRIHCSAIFQMEFYEGGEFGEPGEIGGRQVDINAFIRPFDMDRAPLLRAGIIKGPNRQYIFMLDMHHIIADGMSQDILTREFISLYKGKNLASLSARYKDYSRWQQRADVKAAMQRQEEYWLQQLTGEIPVLNLPADYPRPVVRNFDGGRVRFRLDEHLTGTLNRVAREHGTTLFMILAALYNVFLVRITNHDDIVVGIPIAGRKHADLDGIMGMFVNTLVLRNTHFSETVFADFLCRVKIVTLEAFENQDYLLEDLVEKIVVERDTSRNPLFDAMFVLQNTAGTPGGAIPAAQEIPGLKIAPYDYNNRTAKFDLTLAAIEVGAVLHCYFEFSRSLFREETIERFTHCFKRIAGAAVADPGISINRIDIVPEDEKLQLIHEFNNTCAPHPKDKTVHRLFEEQVEKTPDNRAAVDSDGKGVVTYRQLNEQSNCLAWLLRSRGVKQGVIAAALLERSIPMLVGILGILKAGGAYLPIDTSYPINRVRYMLADSATTVLITAKETGYYAGIHDDGIDVLEPWPGDQADHSVANLGNTSIAGDLLYVIYTSGSTGNPKGVLVEHSGFVNMLQCHKRLFGEDHTSRLSQVAGQGFDAMALEVWPALVNGAALYFADEESRGDGRKMKEWLIANHINQTFQPPIIAEQLLREEWPGDEKVALRVMLTGGDRLSLTPLRHYPFRLYNLYGPTEDTVWTTCSEVGVNPQMVEGQLPDIGGPIGNHRVFIVDPFFNLQPIGIPGEILIGGDGVARGYLNRPELTAEKFAQDLWNYQDYHKEKNKSFYGGAVPAGAFFSKKVPLVLYKTGDLAKWLPDGKIAFLGRLDHQVKIRGYRIELGEIETRLTAHREIKEAVVNIKETGSGNNQLCAYYVSDSPLEAAGLIDHLSLYLPAYMIPSYFVRIPRIPLTKNGKIDREVLPEPLQRGTAVYRGPRNDVETELVKAWQKVLGREKISIDDNFFISGGDSIKAIQVLSRLKREGYKLALKDLFQYPSIALLALKVEKLQREIDQSPVTGKIPLTPIQEAFFHSNKVAPHHFNQSVMLRTPGRLDEEAVKWVFTRLQEHHDALRITFRREDNGDIVQENQGTVQPPALEVHDFQGIAGVVALLEEKAKGIQAGICLETGPLMKLGLFRLDDGDRLLIVIHHLVIDGVSWRILFEDIETLHRQYANGEAPVLPLKTDSFKHHAQRLQEYASSAPFLKEIPYWRELESRFDSTLPRDFEQGSNLIEDTRRLTFRLGQDETDLLLTRVHYAFGTEINDILLTALGLAVRETFGSSSLLVALEGHGREDLSGETDLSRTVGWFTSVYPVLLDTSYAADPGRQLKETKETLRKIPNKGIGYGILQYLAAEEYRKGVNPRLKPQIIFNYLGQFDADLNRMPSFQVATEPIGSRSASGRQRDHDLEVSGLISANCLEMSIQYSDKQYDGKTISGLLGHFQKNLSRLIAYCSRREKSEATPADFTYKGLTISQLEALQSQYKSPIEDIYGLSPMQSGMLYHKLVSPSSFAYFEQSSCRLRGEFDIPLVEKSLKQLLMRHHVLRTNFVHEDLDTPLQVVLKEREIDFYHEDLRKISSREERENFVKAYKEKDKLRSFDLTRDVLMRVSLLRTGEAEFELMWSFHHIIMDGWCVGILNTEFFEIYTGYIENRPYRLPELKPYRTYIQWLEKQDKESSARYWENYLDSFEEPTGVRVPRTKKLKEENGNSNENVSLELDMEKTAELNKLAGRNHVTLNIVIQTLWGILLGKYNGKEDVVFGAVVSGRPFELEGVESMVGLFINTIPVRIRIEEKMKFYRLLQQVQQEALNSEHYHYHPLAEIQSQSALKQNLIDHILIFENYPIAEQIEGYGEEKNRSNKASFKFVNVEVFEQTNYDFNVLLEVSDRLRITFQYNGNWYNGDFVKRISKHFNFVIGQVIENQEVTVKELTLLSGEEKSQIIYEFNDTEAVYPKDKTIHQLFEEKVERTPDHIAIFSHGRTRTNTDNNMFMVLSYRELNEHSNRLAGLLMEKGVEPDTIVGVMIERSIEMIIGILGILKSGGAYLPIDPEYPEERINYMLKDSGAKLLVTTSNLAAESERVRRWDGEKVLLEFIIHHSNQLSSHHSSFIIHHSNQLCYIIYTSGTTGRPKGSLIEHWNVVRLLFNDKFQFDITDNDVWTMFHSYCFDFSVWEMYGALLYGGKLVIVPKMVARDTGEFLELLNSEAVTVLNQTPSAFYNLINEALSPHRQVKKLYIKYVIFGGEALNPLKLKNWLEKYPQTNLINMFGITETTVHVTYKEISEKDIELNIGNIGKPIPTLRTYVLDRYLKPVPVGVMGEICVGGDGLGRGYLNRVELTEGKFIENPYNLGDRLYRSGDTGRFMENGDMEYLGRIDHQVKIRGFRIELGEIERRLTEYPEIKETVVLAREEETGDKYLCAYIVSGRELEIPGLREYLAKDLPDYMIPSYFVPIDKIPLTPNGKIDRSALPEAQIESGKDYIAPRDVVEEKLAGIWNEVLFSRDSSHGPAGIVGIDDDFFQLGGHSLKAVIMLSRVHRELNVKIPLAEIFRAPTVKGMADYVRKSVPDRYASIEPTEKKEYYALSSAQKRMYILQRMYEQALGYNITSATGLEGDIDEDRFLLSFIKLIKRHSSLRTSFIMIEGEPVQKINDDVPFYIEHFDAPTQNETTVPGLIKKFIRPFELSRPPLLRVALIKVNHRKYVLVTDIHHIITDGVSEAILAEDFLSLYNGEKLPRLSLEYKDYTEWQHHFAGAAEFEKQEAYWLKEFQGEIHQLDLPTDYDRPTVFNFAGDYVSRIIGQEVLEKVNGLTKNTSTTPTMVLLAVYYILLSKYSGQEDIVVGSSMAGRKHSDLQHIIGMFVNVLPLRNRPVREKSFSLFLTEVKENLLAALENQDYQFDQLVGTLGIKRETGRNPLFDVVFNMIDQGNEEVKKSDLKISPYKFKHETTVFDLIFSFSLRDNGVHTDLKYATQLFARGTVEKMLERYIDILKQVLEKNDIKLEDIQLPHDLVLTRSSKQKYAENDFGF